MAATDTVKNLWNKSGSHPIRSLGLCLPFCRRTHETALTILIDITDHALASWTSYSDRCSGCPGKYRHVVMALKQVLMYQLTQKRVLMYQMTQGTSACEPVDM